MGPPAPAAAAGRILVLESVTVVALALTLSAWFAGWPPWPAWLPALALGAGLAIRWVALRALGRPPDDRPRRLPSAETVVCLAAAVVYRLPALLHPWGWVNRDGAYGAFVALHLLEGDRPAPPFTEGANYQGTLKSHLAAGLALPTGARDLSGLMAASSLLLFLVFVVATMALARRLGGRPAALGAGLYLAVGPRFLTVFSLNCVGQYVDVLALGGAALAVLAALLDHDRHGAAARGPYFGVGLLLGAAFWQQPVALSYVGAAGLALALRRRTWRDPWVLLVGAGLLMGALPALLWNLQNAWASTDILGRDAAELKAQADALPQLVRRTVQISLPILAGLSPGHPWADAPAVRPLASLLLPAALAGFVAVRARPLWTGLRRGTPGADLLALGLTLCCLGLFWATAAGRVYWRPRYLLPLLAAGAVHLGVSGGWLWRRSRPAAALALAALLALNVAGTLPRLREGRSIAAYYRQVVRSLEAKGIRTGYADFSLSAPVTMFTAERIVLSPRLGPTPAYESESQARLLERAGPDAFVLRPEDDAEAFAAVLRGLGVSFRLDRHPIPVFHALSRRVRLDEVAGFRTSEPAEADPE